MAIIFISCAVTRERQLCSFYIVLRCWAVRRRNWLRTWIQTSRLSPDGRKLAFMRYDNPEPGKYRLIVRSLENDAETVLASGPSSQL